MLQILLVFLFKICLITSLVQGTKDNDRKPYIVYMGDVRNTRTSMVDAHNNLLRTAIGDERLARESKIYSYKRSFSGFAAKLLPHEAKTLLDQDGVISVFPNKKRKLHTTRSWNFLGLPEIARRNSKSESDIIVGMFDTGICMDAPSFNDKGYGPPPAKWKGKCVKGANFTGCNNKVIGAKYFNLENVVPETEASPVDTNGHGTHTASTVAGVPVKGASLYGIAKGTARGGVPSARIAIYKVCWGEGCTDMDILAAFDEAIADGVDIISISIGGDSREYFDDPIAIGSFHAMKKGILTSCSAGNSGPDAYTVENVAPWVMTVAATTIDRQFKTGLILGNGFKTLGVSINTFTPAKRMYPLTSGALAANTSVDYGNASACDYGTLRQDKIKGKLVYCLGNSGQDYDIKEMGGAGIIFSTDYMADVPLAALVPGTSVDTKTGDLIDKYIKSTRKAQAVIFKTMTVPAIAPYVASFSSRGPQLISKNILKPDVAAPGQSILAGYSKIPSITEDSLDKRHSVFNILSGTSMSCPHVTAAAAYVKSFHPDWSPAAIKSAIMTTATPIRISDSLAQLSYGAGQISPTRALDPGLIYDVTVDSYISFLCKEGYNGTSIGLLLGQNKSFDCSSLKPAKGIDGLNYPSMHIQLQNMSSPILEVFYRTVTNVGSGKSIYKAIVTSPKGLSVAVVPNVLKFNKPQQTRSFKLVVKGGRMQNQTGILSGSLEWSDSIHRVKSPILVYIGNYS